MSQAKVAPRTATPFSEMPRRDSSMLIHVDCEAVAAKQIGAPGSNNHHFRSATRYDPFLSPCHTELIRFPTEGQATKRGALNNLSSRVACISPIVATSASRTHASDRSHGTATLHGALHQCTSAATAALAPLSAGERAQTGTK